MKSIRLFFIVYLLCYSNPFFAQEELSNGYVFPDFENGNVFFRNGRHSSAFLNYNKLTQEMLFLDESKNIMKIANPTEVLVVVIGERRFLPVSSKGVFYEEIQVENGSFFVQYIANMISEGKAAAYGGYSQTSSVTSLGSMQDGFGNTFKLTPNEKFRMKHQNAYYLLLGKNYKVFNSSKSLAKLFKGQELKIEEFAKEHSINFTNIEDITKIVEYGYSLAKK